MHIADWEKAVTAVLRHRPQHEGFALNEATFLGLATNALLAAGKLAAGLFGHSHALVADAVESLADVFSSVVVWRGLVVAAAPDAFTS